MPPVQNSKVFVTIIGSLLVCAGLVSGVYLPYYTDIKRVEMPASNSAGTRGSMWSNMNKVGNRKPSIAAKGGDEDDEDDVE